MPKATRKTRRTSSRKTQRKGSRKGSRKQGGGASAWNMKVMEVYQELKRKNPATRLVDAMREASRRYK